MKNYKKGVTIALSVLLIAAVIAYIVCVFVFIFSENKTLVIIGGAMLFTPAGLCLLYMIVLICVNIVLDILEKRSKR